MAHAWKACWVQALGGSNPPSSAPVIPVFSRDRDSLGDVQIEVLHIRDCPSWTEAGRRVREALTLTGRDNEIHFRLMESVKEATPSPPLDPQRSSWTAPTCFPAASERHNRSAASTQRRAACRACPRRNRSSKRWMPVDAETLVRCSCCGRTLPRRKVHALDDGAAFLCRNSCRCRASRSGCASVALGRTPGWRS